jgi:hypothetical protein
VQSLYVMYTESCKEAEHEAVQCALVLCSEFVGQVYRYYVNLLGLSLSPLYDPCANI